VQSRDIPPYSAKPTSDQLRQAREQLDAQVRDMVQWHFNPETGTPFWLDRAKTFRFDPLKDVKGFDDLKLFGLFEDEWLRGAPGLNIRRWVPKAYQDKPLYVFETGGTTGIPKSRTAYEDFRIDYSMMSETLPDDYFPRGSNWLMLGPSGPRRLRLAIEHLAQVRGGICFCVDLDPRWVIKLLKTKKFKEAEEYKQHCIDQALTILSAGHDVKCMFTTPKLLAGLDEALRKKGSSIPETGITGIFSGGTEFTPQFTREALEEMLENKVYMTPTYGNTLMGLACSKPVGPEEGYKITYYAPQPRAAIQVVDPDDPDKMVGYGQTGRVLLTTLTKEFFMPRFLERDEGEREEPYARYPWDGVSGVRPFSRIAAQTTVGVY
jgi:hypothetical protein